MKPDFYDLVATRVERLGGRIFILDHGIVTNQATYVAWLFGQYNKPMPMVRLPDFQPAEVQCPTCLKMPQMVCEHPSGAATDDWHQARVEKAYYGVGSCASCDEPVFMEGLETHGEVFCNEGCLQTFVDGVVDSRSYDSDITNP